MQRRRSPKPDGIGGSSQAGINAYCFFSKATCAKVGEAQGLQMKPITSYGEFCHSKMNYPGSANWAQFLQPRLPRDDGLIVKLAPGLVGVQRDFHRAGGKFLKT